MNKIRVNGIDIGIVTLHERDYISLTDMIKGSEGSDHIRNWMRNRNTVEYLGLWENLNNPDFKGVEFDRFRKEAGLNSFNLTPKKWVDSTNAIGITSKAGKYGGTYAHKDIAFHFGLWISPEFNLLMIKEFQRLKDEEAKGLNQIWDFRRFLSKANYRIQTDAIQEVLVPIRALPKYKEGVIYAEEAELLNKVVFNLTSKEWKQQNPELALTGKNIRDMANTHQLILIANLEPFNAELIRNNISQEERFKILRKSAIEQLKSLLKSQSIQDTYIESPDKKGTPLPKGVSSGVPEPDNAFKKTLKKGKSE